MLLLLTTAYLILLSVRFGLVMLNLRHLRRHGGDVPAEFQSSIDPETLRRSASYSEERTRLGLIRSGWSNAVLLAFLFLGGLALYDAWLDRLTASFVGRGVAFFLCLSWAGLIFDLPFSWYSTFRIEARYGFNHTPPRLFWSDWVKGFILSSALIALLAAAGFYLAQLAPQSFWFWTWAAYAAFSVLLIFISPYVIEPLFFKLRPITGGQLEESVRSLAERTGVLVKQVYEMDASRRSSHSNAYFTGLGRVKRVVLFDTLLKSMTIPEITAILAHELGHWRLKHVTKRLWTSLALGLLGFFLGFQLLSYDHLPHLVGLDQASFAARVLIVGFVAELVTFPLTPLFSSWSRRHEWQADRFACELTSRPNDLSTALVKLARDNLANLHPHPLYAAFYHSHPPMVERVRKLQESTRAPSTPIY